MGKIVRCKTVNVSQIKTLIEVLSGILDNTNITFGRYVEETSESNKPEKKAKKSKKSKDDKEASETKKYLTFPGMRILAVSPDKTVLICLKLYASKFDSYVCKPEEYNINLSLPQLYKLIKTTDKADELEFSIDSDEKQILTISTVSASNNKVLRKSDSELKLMETIQANLTPPSIEPDVMITMEAQEFHKLCKNMASIGGVLEIKCTNSTLVFTCVGDISSNKTTYTSGDDGIKIAYMHPNKNLIFQGMYKLGHLNLFAKCTTLSNDIQIMMKLEKYPIFIKYTVATLGDFIAVISPMEQKAQTFDDNQYSDEEVKLKDEYNESVKEDD